MTRVKPVPRLAAMLILVGAATTANAGMIHSYSIDNPGGNSNGGELSNITTSYDVNNSIFNWSYTVNNKNDGFWLVVSDGPNPKSNTNEYAILYGDLDNDKLVAYEYSGQNNANSYNTPGNLLGSWDSIFDITPAGGNNKTVSFSLDVTGINSAQPGNPDWDGIAFADKIGIWFHPSRGTKVTYDSNNKITGFSYKGQGWHDSNNQMTTSVPEPATPLLFAAGLLSLMGLRRKNSSS